MRAERVAGRGAEAGEGGGSAEGGVGEVVGKMDRGDRGVEDIIRAWDLALWIQNLVGRLHRVDVGVEDTQILH